MVLTAVSPPVSVPSPGKTRPSNLQEFPAAVGVSPPLTAGLRAAAAAPLADPKGWGGVRGTGERDGVREKSQASVHLALSVG